MLPISAVLGIVCTRIIIDDFGKGAYVQYGLIVGLGSLLPFADLGMSAAVINAVGASRDPRTDSHVRDVLITSVRVLTGSAIVLLVVTGAITLLHGWGQLIGHGISTGSGATSSAVCMALLAVTMVFGFGDRVLTGLGKNHISIGLSAALTPIVLVVLLVSVRFGVDIGGYVAIVPYAVTFLIAVAACVIAGHRIAPTVGTALRAARHVRTVHGAKVFNIAWPMLLQMIALPIAMQTDRLVLSHVSNLQNVAEYNLASQMYTPVWGVVSSAGVALWPIFARNRATPTAEKLSPMRMSLAFAGFAAVVCLIISLASSWLAARASGGEIHLEVGLLASFSALMIVQAAKYPLGMYMTDVRGMRFQAVMIVLLMPVNLGLSIVLGRHLGAPGPVLGSVVGVIICQVLANVWYVHRDLARTVSQDVRLAAS